MSVIVSDDPTRLDRDRVHGWIAGSYWAAGIPRATFDRALDGSLCFGAYDDAGALLGFARVITDGATFAYLCDVYVDEARRGLGVGGALMTAIHAHPRLQGLRRWMLVTRDAHGLYARHGWTPPPDPKLFMQKHDPDIYLAAAGLTAAGGSSGEDQHPDDLGGAA